MSDLHTLQVAVDPPYPVHIGPGALDLAPGLLASSTRVALLADARVRALHGERLGPLARAPWVELPEGEASKTFAVLERTLERLASLGLDRHSTLLTLGGGATSDLGGLAASLYMRGIGVLHAPTTLLAQVDAAVGGKTAVNLSQRKNLAGTFHQPAAVLMEPAVLATQEEEHYRSGLGELLKTALVGDPDLLGQLEEGGETLARRDPAALAAAVGRAVAVKARVVAADEKEGGPRRALNLGHTFGHAIESVAGHGRIAHGVAVAAGIGLALAAAQRLGELRDPSLVERVRAACRALGLPPDLGELRRATALELPAERLVAAMRGDKKARSGEILLVLPRAAGDLALEVPAGEAFLLELLS